jgi:hypothetical protein
MQVHTQQTLSGLWQQGFAVYVVIDLPQDPPPPIRVGARSILARGRFTPIFGRGFTFCFAED